MRYQASDEAKDRLSFGFYFLIFVLFVFVSGSILWISSQRSRFENKEVVKEFVLEPMASVEARLVSANTQTFSIKILNATGVSGLAVKSAKSLEAQGVKINLQTGNASNANGIKASFKNNLLKDSKLGSSVKAIWPNAEMTMTDSQEEDLVLVIGK